MHTTPKRMRKKDTKKKSNKHDVPDLVTLSCERTHARLEPEITIKAATSIWNI